MIKAWYVYFLQSEVNGHIYVGSTNAAMKRLKEHNRGEVQSTKSARPWRLKGFVAVPSEAHARELEDYFKTGSGKAILKKRFIAEGVLA